MWGEVSGRTGHLTTHWQNFTLLRDSNIEQKPCSLSFNMECMTWIDFYGLKSDPDNLLRVEANLSGQSLLCIYMHAGKRFIICLVVSNNITTHCVVIGLCSLDISTVLGSLDLVVVLGKLGCNNPRTWLLGKNRFLINSDTFSNQWKIIISEIWIQFCIVLDIFSLYHIFDNSQQLRDPSRAPSFIGSKHQPYPTNHAISRHINNSKARKLQFCMMWDKIHDYLKLIRKQPSCLELLK